MGSGAIYKRLGFLVETLGKGVPVPEREGRMEVLREHLSGDQPLAERAQKAHNRAQDANTVGEGMATARSGDGPVL